MERIWIKLSNLMEEFKLGIPGRMDTTQLYITLLNMTDSLRVTQLERANYDAVCLLT